MSDKRLMTTKEVANLVGCCPRTVHRLVAAGQLPRPVISHGKVHRWRPEDLERHLEQRARMQV